MDSKYRRDQALHHQAILAKLVDLHSSNIEANPSIPPLESETASKLDFPSTSLPHSSTFHIQPQVDQMADLRTEQLPSLVEDHPTISSNSDSHSTGDSSSQNHYSLSSNSSSTFDTYLLSPPQLSFTQPQQFPEYDSMGDVENRGKYQFQTNIAFQPDLEEPGSNQDFNFSTMANSVHRHSYPTDPYTTAEAWSCLGLDANAPAGIGGIFGGMEQKHSLTAETLSNLANYQQASIDPAYGFNISASSPFNAYANSIYNTSFPTYQIPDAVKPLSVFGDISNGLAESPCQTNIASPLQSLSPAIIDASDSTSEVQPMQQSRSAQPLSPDRLNATVPSKRGIRRKSEGHLGQMGMNRKRSATPSRTHLSYDEKMARAAATAGLSKEDKRRVQNKLAQRAFRARSKVTNRSASSKLVQLEEMTEAQCDRISQMSAFVTRLQKENDVLKISGIKEENFV